MPLGISGTIYSSFSFLLNIKGGLTLQPSVSANGSLHLILNHGCDFLFSLTRETMEFKMKEALESSVTLSLKNMKFKKANDHIKSQGKFVNTFFYL